MTEKGALLAQQDEAVLDVCRKYCCDLEHARHVADLADVLFDAFLPLHGLFGEERAVLCHAALMHDIGYFVDRKGHHRHGAYLVRSDERLQGYPADMRDLCARVVRNHRRRARGGPKRLGHAGREALRWLSALLRVADALDYDHEQRALVSGVRGRGRGFEILVAGLDPLRLGERLQTKAGLLAQAAGGPIHFERVEL
ncbi:MAG: HD domain-containing protein [Thermaerobacter sp.]|nr:HD domain-containing protein [Thermaerobacter sp.]